MLKFIFKDRLNFFDLFIIAFTSAMLAEVGLTVTTILLLAVISLVSSFISTLAKILIERK